MHRLLKFCPQKSTNYSKRCQARYWFLLYHQVYEVSVRHTHCYIQRLFLVAFAAVQIFYDFDKFPSLCWWDRVLTCVISDREFILDHCVISILRIFWGKLLIPITCLLRSSQEVYCRYFFLKRLLPASVHFFWRPPHHTFWIWWTLDCFDRIWAHKWIKHNR